jgi:short-subunit dehydrogenase
MLALDSSRYNMSRYIPVKGHSGLVRDTESNALINVDKNSIQLAREKKELRKKKRQQEQDIKQRIDSIEADVSDIKRMIEVLISKIN